LEVALQGLLNSEAVACGDLIETQGIRGFGKRKEGTERIYLNVQEVRNPNAGVTGCDRRGLRAQRGVMTWGAA